MSRSAAYLLLAALAVAPACNHVPSTSFPYGMSLDKHNFISTPHRPISLSLTDTTTGDTLWQLDVPVGKKAVIDFNREGGWNAAAANTGGPAKTIEWAVMEPDKAIEYLDHSQNLGGQPVLLKVSIREEDRPESRFVGGGNEPIRREQPPIAPGRRAVPPQPGAPAPQRDQERPERDRSPAASEGPPSYRQQGTDTMPPPVPAPREPDESIESETNAPAAGGPADESGSSADDSSDSSRDEADMEEESSEDSSPAADQGQTPQEETESGGEGAETPRPMK